MFRADSLRWHRVAACASLAGVLTWRAGVGERVWFSRGDGVAWRRIAHVSPRRYAPEADAVLAARRVWSALRMPRVL